MNGVCGFGARELAHLFICSGLNPAEQGPQIWPTLRLIESPGPVEQREGGREGWTERRKEDRPPGWETRSRSIFPLQPISHVLSLCPFLLMTHFLCPSAHFQARSRRRRKRKKKKERKEKKVEVPRCMFVRACRGAGGVGGLPPEGCQSWLLSSSPLPPGDRASRHEAPQVSSTPFPLPRAMPAEVAASKALSAHNALEASSSSS